ncbi:hypothetical protein D0Y65_035629 [Glycine soja]|uniref:Uncharacterized protein n=1 Tax=Glycine soja TaxID=3848 RepID=A0A445HBA8_GLYSO|nr:hypothetical protein D0Y65_035629 [Glycine soja]
MFAKFLFLFCFNVFGSFLTFFPSLMVFYFVCRTRCRPRKLLANFQIGKLIIGNIHRLQDIYWLQVMCLIKCQDDIFGYIFLFLIGIFERYGCICFLLCIMGLLFLFVL